MLLILEQTTALRRAIAPFPAKFANPAKSQQPKGWALLGMLEYWNSVNEKDVCAQSLCTPNLSPSQLRQPWTISMGGSRA